uniref:Putative secreted protein n=1 Tax=Ixodes ricinus TaxID=34613 RepID=A0A6B0V4G7_IXORI
MMMQNMFFLMSVFMWCFCANLRMVLENSGCLEPSLFFTPNESCWFPVHAEPTTHHLPLSCALSRSSREMFSSWREQPLRKSPLRTLEACSTMEGSQFGIFWMLLFRTAFNMSIMNLFLESWVLASCALFCWRSSTVSFNASGSCFLRTNPTERKMSRISSTSFSVKASASLRIRSNTILECTTLNTNRYDMNRIQLSASFEVSLFCPCS